MKISAKDCRFIEVVLGIIVLLMAISLIWDKIELTSWKSDNIAVYLGTHHDWGQFIQLLFSDLRLYGIVLLVAGGVFLWRKKS